MSGVESLVRLIGVCWPVVDRRPLTFLVSPRKVSKRRRPRSRCPSGCSREFGQHAVRLRNGLRLQAQTPSPVCAQQKMGNGRNSPSPCSAHLRLQAETVTQARGVPRETPASPQTTPISDPFSAVHKRQRHSGTSTSKTTLANVCSIHAPSGREVLREARGYCASICRDLPICRSG